MNDATKNFTNLIGIKHPIICGAMYPCSNPELVAAVSGAGGIGIVQPLSFVYVHNYEFKTALNKIRAITSNPIGMNIITEKSSKIYMLRMSRWLEEALEFGIKFFITSLGNPKWVIDKVSKFNGIVFHDVTEKKWALKAIDEGASGLICVNKNAGGHAGIFSMEEMFDELSKLGLPLICAGGIGDKNNYLNALKLGYAGVQMGTRFISTDECNSNLDYKNAIINSTAKDIILTEKVTGIPLSVINTEYVKKVGTKVGFIGKYFLLHPKFKHFIRAYYTLLSAIKLKRSILNGNKYNNYFQAGKSVDGITSIISAKEVVENFSNFAEENF